jgi:hypothetical protein
MLNISSYCCGIYSNMLWARSTLIHSVRAACYELDRFPIDCNILSIRWFLYIWTIGNSQRLNISTLNFFLTYIGNSKPCVMITSKLTTNGGTTQLIFEFLNWDRAKTVITLVTAFFVSYRLPIFWILNFLAAIWCFASCCCMHRRSLKTVKQAIASMRRYVMR